jgi:hypothetical protein
LQASYFYKDLPIAIVSFDCLFYLVSVIKNMLIGSAMVTLACVGMYFGSFNMAKVLFATGVSFALIKVSVTLDWYCY